VARVGLTAPFDPKELNELWAELERKTIERMDVQRIDRDKVRLSRFAEMRYPLQINQVMVPAPDGDYDDAVVDDLIASYEREYARLFGEGTGYAEAGHAITSLKVEGRAQISDQQMSGQDAADEVDPPDPTERRPVTFVGPVTETVETPVYDGLGLAPGARIDGPAVIALPNTSVVVPGDARVTADPFGSLILEINAISEVSA
jgi:N-methylhydantoinase A